MFFFPTVALTIDVIEVDVEHPFGNSLWHNAMVTVNINWHAVSTVGEYFILNVFSEWLSSVLNIMQLGHTSRQLKVIGSMALSTCCKLSS